MKVSIDEGTRKIVMRDIAPRTIGPEDATQDPDINFIKYVEEGERQKAMLDSGPWEPLSHVHPLDLGEITKLPTEFLGRMIAGPNFSDEHEATTVWAGRIQRIFSTSRTADRPFEELFAEIVQTDGSIRTVSMFQSDEKILLLRETTAAVRKKEFNIPNYRPSNAMKAPVVVPLSPKARHFKTLLELNIGNILNIVRRGSAMPETILGVELKNGEWIVRSSSRAARKDEFPLADIQTIE